jgi:hypothetical protein
MAAIITDDFRKNTTKLLIDEIVAGTQKYYIGIGKSDPWTDTAADELVAGFAPNVPDGSIAEKEEAKDNLIGLIQVSRKSRVIPRIEYQPGLIYKRYDAGDPTAFIPTISGNITLQPCYAIYQDKIYVCLRNKTDESNPNGQTTLGNDQPQVGGANDYALAGGGGGTNYQWAFVADVQPSSSGFNTSQFVEVSSSDIAAATTAAETTGVIYGVKMISGGAGYTTSTVVNIVGNNSDLGGTLGGTDLDVVIDGSGAITHIDIVGGVVGTGWTEASVVITDTTGTGAEARVLIGPSNGFGYNVAKDLPSFYLGLEASLEGNLEGDAPVIPYRQVSLLRGTEASVRTADSDTDGVLYTAEETLDTLRYFACDSVSSTVVTAGDIVTVQVGNGENPRAFVDYIANNRIYFHQNNNDKVNKKSFPATGTVEILDRENESATPLVSVNYNSIGNSEYNQKAGEILFYENRTQITRSAQQTEDIKLVIQL